MSMWSASRDWQGLECEPAIESLCQDLEWVGVTTFQSEARGHSYLRWCLRYKQVLGNITSSVQKKGRERKRQIVPLCWDLLCLLEFCPGQSVVRCSFSPKFAM